MVRFFGEGGEAADLVIELFDKNDKRLHDARLLSFFSHSVMTTVPP